MINFTPTKYPAWDCYICQKQKAVYDLEVWHEGEQLAIRLFFCQQCRDDLARRMAAIDTFGRVPDPPARGT